MRGPFAGPLEARANPSRWADLFDLALPALDCAMGDEPHRLARGETPRWTLGGGTALALRLGHRVSDDIDIFLSAIRLAELTPAKNPAAKKISERFNWPGHYLKFIRPEGEIDFLSSALQTIPGFSLETFRDRTIPLETVAEVMVKKLRYRSANFTPRDAFDLVCVLKAKPETVLILAAEVGDTVALAKLALVSLTDDKVRSVVRADPVFRAVLQNPIETARNGLDHIAYHRDHPISANMADFIAKAVEKVDLFKPGSKRGTINFNWTDSSQRLTQEQLVTLDKRPVEFKAALLNAWSRKDPDSFLAWDSQGRPAAERSRSVARDHSTPDR